MGWSLNVVHRVDYSIRWTPCPILEFQDTYRRCTIPVLCCTSTPIIRTVPGTGAVPGTRRLILSDFRLSELTISSELFR